MKPLKGAESCKMMNSASRVVPLWWFTEMSTKPSTGACWMVHMNSPVRDQLVAAQSEMRCDELRSDDRRLRHRMNEGEVDVLHRSRAHRLVEHDVPQW